MGLRSCDYDSRLPAFADDGYLYSTLKERFIFEVTKNYLIRKKDLVMKKILLAVMTITAVMLAPASLFAAEAVVPATSAVVQPAERDSNTVMVTVNGMEMTQAQARLIIIQNIKNHRQMTPEEMVAYINNLEANANNK